MKVETEASLQTFMRRVAQDPSTKDEYGNGAECTKPLHWLHGLHGRDRSAALAALAMGAYDDALGNTVRPLFSTIGPLLSLSASILLVEAGNARTRST